MRTLCIIQARTGSTRLPGKVLRPLLGEPMLAWVIRRVRRCRLVDEVVVATTDLPADDAILEVCEREACQTSRGSESDVLDRYYRAALPHEPEFVVRITSDCPLIDPSVTDCVVETLQSAVPKADYACNTLPRTFPRGLDVEVFAFEALETAWRECDRAEWREHVTPYLYDQEQRFRRVVVANDVDYSDLRWTVDTSDDFELIRRIYDHFGASDFGWTDVLAALAAHREWTAINHHVEQKPIG